MCPRGSNNAVRPLQSLPMPDHPELMSASDAYRRLLGYAAPYWKAFVIAVIGMLFVAGTETAFAWLMKPMLNGSFVDKDPEIIRLIPGAIVAVFLVRAFSGFVVTYGMEWIGRNVIHDLRRTIFTHYLRLPSRFFDNISGGQLSSKLIFDVEQVAVATTKAVTILIRDTLTVIFLVVYMVYLSWKLSIFFLIVVPVISMIILLIGKRFRLISRRIQSSMGDVAQISRQVVEGNKVVKIYGGEAHEQSQFHNANNFNRRQYMKMAATNAVSIQVSQFFGALALAGMLYYATSDSMLKVMDVGTFMSFVAASMLLLAPMKRLTQVMQSVQQGIAAAQSIFYMLDEPLEQDSGRKTLQRVDGKLEFSEVNFRYDRSHDYVLHHINFTVQPGQTVAIVGRSGSGKSTLVSLLPRFYEPTSGEITIDGVPLNELTLANLRQHIAYVAQDVTLFNESVRNNIAYGSNRDVSEEQLLRACEAAHASEFIRELPQGLDTLIGDKGVLLSGGQRQRLAIARALLKDAPILILDEATSALDTESERYIQEALEKLMVGRTTLVIAHRLSTIENADRILVLHNGRLVEEGTHAQLLGLNGHYTALHKMQFHDESRPN